MGHTLILIIFKKPGNALIYPRSDQFVVRNTSMVVKFLFIVVIPRKGKEKEKLDQIKCLIIKLIERTNTKLTARRKLY